MKKNLLLVFIFISATLRAQDYYSQLQNEALELIQKKNYSESLVRTQKILEVYPDLLLPNVFHAFNLINLNRVSEATPYIDNGLEMWPTNYLFYLLKSYEQTANGNKESGRKYLMQSILFRPKISVDKELSNEIRLVGINLNKSLFNSLADWCDALQKNPPARQLTLDSTINAFYANSASANKIKELNQQFSQQFIKNNQPELSVYVYALAARCLSDNGFKSEALDLSMEGYQQYKKNDFASHHTLAANMMLSIVNNFMAANDYEHAIQYIDDILVHSDQLRIHTIDVEGLIKASVCYRNLGNTSKASEAAYAAYKLSEKNNYLFGMANAANAVCATLISSYNGNENNLSVHYGEASLRICEKYKIPLVNETRSNLALAYWNLGDNGKQKAINMYQSLIQSAKNENKFADASLYCNNLGAMFYNRAMWAEAAVYLEESVRLAPSGSAFSNPKDRLSFYREQLSASSFLILCYAKMGNAEKAFQAMESRRARVLAERLNHHSDKKPSLADLQKLLKEDEACIMYSVFSGHEIAILTVSKKYAQVVFQDDPRFIGDIKDKYFNKGQQDNQQAATQPSRGFERVSLREQGYVQRDLYDREAVASRQDFDRINDLTRKFFEHPGTNDAFLMDCLSRYQKFLIVPVNNRLTGIKNLLIAPDDVLNLLPFEALRTFDGKYLVEKYNIRYLHSTAVLQQLEERNYNSSRKPLLAMGGAIYQDLDTEPMALNSNEDWNVLQAEVYENLKTNSSQRKAYVSLFGQHAMNALPGTLDEVKNISKNLTGAEIFSGAEMTENRIKAMSKSDQLKNYKVLHLATHGFVIPDVPELSGVAMCIFTKEQNGEDGFLNANEIAQLKLNTDLTVLSACQTAQGKIYPGEGVTGLTQSLIIAGSNAALVSLWPVNDTSTMLFMSNFYKEVAKGKSYIQIVNELKRKFIKGEFGKEFQHPNFWAPFIYYGK